MPYPVVTVPHHASHLVRHRLGGWMPYDRKHWREWLKNTVDHVRQNHKRSKEQLNPTIQALWNLIEDNTDVRMLFNMMLEQVPMAYPYNTNPAGGVEFRSWQEMLLTFDYQLTQGPVWLYNTAGQQGLIGFPFNAFLDWPMGTSAGVYAFLRRDINKCLGDMLNAYGTFLQSSASLAVINQSPTGWLNPTAQSVMVTVATSVTPPMPPPVPQTFEDVYVCNPSAPNYGFTSWDSFFTRQFHPGLRPVYEQSNNAIINNACESAPYALKTGVRLHDQFWLKGQPYSLADMIGDKTWAEKFVGGTVYQAFLSALSYHCWNSPVNGTVQAVMNIPGTYYAANYWEGFANIGPNNMPDPDPSAANLSQGYITQVATRGVAIIEIAGGLGTLAIVMVGMAEVSSCEWEIKAGDTVTKGQPIGTFHFGGSTHCLVFSPNMKLTFVPAATPPYPADEINLAVSSQLATISTT